MKFNYTQFLKAISLALDLAELDYFKVNLNHSRRVAYLSYIIGKNLNLSQDDLDDLFALALLHDNGITISAIKYHKLNYEILPEHCIVGENNIKNLPLRKNRKDIILYHHENYDGSGIFKKQKDEIPFFSSIIHFADTLDTTFKFESLSYLERKAVKYFGEENKEKLFHPDVVNAFLKKFNCERMWCDLKFYNKEEILDRIAPKIIYNFNWEKIKKVSEIFIEIIDSKSKFTYNHTKGIANLVEKFCKHYKFSKSKTNQMIIAAYLHDLGKLYIPNEILDKPDKLNEFEFYEIKQHTYFTKLALEKIDGFEKIAQWAANHHEKLNGNGYPECLKADEIDFESRIIAICDIYQALTEERPYRKGLSKEEAIKIMKKMADGGFIDKDILNDLISIV